MHVTFCFIKNVQFVLSRHWMLLLGSHPKLFWLKQNIWHQSQRLNIGLL